MFGSCHMDPTNTDSVTTTAQGPKASVGGLYEFHSNKTSNTSPTGLYRYVKIADAVAVTNGMVLCADLETGASIVAATPDRSADVASVAACGVAVCAVVAPIDVGVTEAADAALP